MQGAWVAVLICAPLQKKLGKLHGFSPHPDIKGWWQVYHLIDVCEVSTWLMSHASVDLHPQYKGHNTGKQLHTPLWVWASFVYAARSQQGFCKLNPWYISVNPGSVWVSAQVSVCTCPPHICWDWLGKSNLSSCNLCLILTYPGHNILAEESILEIKSVAPLSFFDLTSSCLLKHVGPMITWGGLLLFYKESEWHLSKYTSLLGYIAIFSSNLL